MKLESTYDFWSQHPCGHSSIQFEIVRKHRYRLEKALPGIIKDFQLSDQDVVLELGCGQGVDGVEILKQGPKKYIGVDFSVASIKKFSEYLSSFSEFKGKDIELFTGNIANLSFLVQESIDLVYSFGVIHHTGNVQRVMKEIERVLKPKGVAEIFVYNLFCPKVFMALLLRRVQRIFDFFTGRSQTLYHLIKWIPRRYFGTMVHECFGVPILEAYTKGEVLKKYGVPGTRLVHRWYGSSFLLPSSFAYMHHLKIVKI